MSPNLFTTSNAISPGLFVGQVVDVHKPCNCKERSNQTYPGRFIKTGCRRHLRPGTLPPPATTPPTRTVHGTCHRRPQSPQNLPPHATPRPTQGCSTEISLTSSKSSNAVITSNKTVHRTYSNLAATTSNKTYAGLLMGHVIDVLRVLKTCLHT